MAAPSRPRDWRRFFLEALVYFILTVIATGAIGVLIGWRTLYEFGTGFFIAAIVALAAGAARAAGYGASRDPMYQYGQTVTRPTTADRVKRDFVGSFSESRFTLQMVLVALLCFALSGLVQSIR